MRRLRFHYEMQLEFSEPVHRHSFFLRCLPKNTEAQRVEQLSCQINPLTSITRSSDAFGNDFCYGYIEPAHSYFSFRVDGLVVTNSENIVRNVLNPLYKFATPQTTLHNGARPYLALAQGLHDPVQQALRMSMRLYTKMRYEPGSTNVRTTAQEALDNGCGVCQDYAHILIALCRQLRIPTRYVAGFMTGEGVTHAWVEIFALGQWIGIDPTHNRIVDDRYIKLSEGRDARDCLVDKGVFWGETEQKQSVAVKVTEEAL